MTKDEIIQTHWLEYLRYWDARPGVKKAPTEQAFWIWYVDHKMVRDSMVSSDNFDLV